MYGAGDRIRELSSNGQLNSLHERVRNLSEQSETTYNELRDKLNQVVFDAQTREDQIYNEATSSYPELRLLRHNSDRYDFNTLLSSRAYISTQNIQNIDKLKSTVDNKAVLRGYHE